MITVGYYAELIKLTSMQSAIMMIFSNDVVEVPAYNSSSVIHELEKLIIVSHTSSHTHTIILFALNLFLFFSAINRGHYLANYNTEALLPLIALPLKVFQGYNDDFSVGPLLSAFPIVPGNHEIIPP